MEFRRMVELEIEELRDSIGVFPFEDSKYSLNYFSIEELNQITDDFSENNLVGRFQFGKVYKAFKGEQVFTVKKWEQPGNGFSYYKGENELRQINEIIFLKQTKVCSHPNLAKLKGYGRINQDQLFMVYDLKPLNSVHNLVPEDSFTWLQRIKVLLGFAHLLHFLHAADRSNPYLLRNIDAAHILVDEDYNPILCDYSMITGGIFPYWGEYPNEYLSGPRGYRPIFQQHPDWSERDDIFAFGTLLLMLISKRVFAFDHTHTLISIPTVHVWGCDSYELRNSAVGFDKISLVHGSLLDNHGYRSDDAVQITKLAIRCVSYRRSKTPTMKQVIKKLLNLVALRDHSTFLGIDRLQCYL